MARAAKKSSAQKKTAARKTAARKKTTTAKTTANKAPAMPKSVTNAESKSRLQEKAVAQA